MITRIGIVGGGQLARMLTFAAKRLGFSVTVLDPTPQSPAGQIADFQIVAQLDDEKAMQKLGNSSDVVTIEWEHANPKLLEQLVKRGIPVHPSSKTLEMIKDKLRQKQFLKKAALPVGEFIEVTTKEDIEKAAKEFGYPILLKSRVGGYDGRGNFLVKRGGDISLGIKTLQTDLYVEKYIPFQKELAIIVARSTKGNIKTFPVTETIHEDNILHTTITPARIDGKTSKKVTTIAKKVMQQLRGAGVFGIEFFLTKSGRVLVNEIAPRVHNSGHYTIEGCKTSQFEQHIRAITDLPLGDTALLKPSVMVNVLGKSKGDTFVKGLGAVLKIPDTYVHIYGKKETRPKRKMGHITVTADSIHLALRNAEKAKKLLSI